jgi:transcription elongation factor Elf1
MTDWVELFKIKNELERLCRHYIHFMFLPGYYGENKRSEFHQKISDLINVPYDTLKAITLYLTEKIGFPAYPEEIEFEEYPYYIMEYGGKMKDWITREYKLTEYKCPKCNHLMTNQTATDENDTYALFECSSCSFSASPTHGELIDNLIFEHANNIDYRYRGASWDDNLSDPDKERFEEILEEIILDNHPDDICYFYTDWNNTIPENYTECYKRHRLEALSLILDEIREAHEKKCPVCSFFMRLHKRTKIPIWGVGYKYLDCELTLDQYKKVIWGQIE